MLTWKNTNNGVVIMSELKELYYIVPHNDGCVYLCKNNDGFFLARKEKQMHSDGLVFEYYDDAAVFIAKHNLDGFSVEPFLTI